jgi:adenylate kinase
MRIRWLALTGTPGVGKSTVAALLRRRGLDVVDGKRFAREHDCLVGVDVARRSQIVDLARVGRALRRAYDDEGSVRVLESHWAHEVPGVDAAIVLRLHPTRLRARLRRRRWSEAKVRENLEAEALDIILQESVQRLGKGRVGEIDTTGVVASTIAARVERAVRAPERELMKLEIGRIDWSEELLKWS